jgi:hypothetical protein
MGTASIVSRAIKRGIVNPGSHERGPELTAEVEAEIMYWIAARSDKHYQLGRIAILPQVRDVSGFPILKGRSIRLSKGAKNPDLKGSHFSEKIPDCNFRDVSSRKQSTT